MGMMLKVLSPCMEHAEKSDIRSQVLRIASQFEHRCGAGAVEQIVDQPLCKLLSVFTLAATPRACATTREYDLLLPLLLAVRLSGYSETVPVNSPVSEKKTGCEGRRPTPAGPFRST
jgi:hypothetical protein